MVIALGRNRRDRRRHKFTTSTPIKLLLFCKSPNNDNAVIAFNAFKKIINSLIPLLLGHRCYY